MIDHEDLSVFLGQIRSTWTESWAAICNIQRRNYVSLVFIIWIPILMQVVIYAYWSYFYFLEVVYVSAQLVVVLNLGGVVRFTDVFKLW